MPIYEYECPDQHRFERFFKRHADAPEETPCEAVTCFDHGCDCGKPARRVISVPSVAKVKRSWEEKANVARSTKRNMIEEQVKQTKLAEEAKKRYGDERCAFED